MAAQPLVSNKTTSPPPHHNRHISESTSAGLVSTQPIDTIGGKGSDAAMLGQSEEEDGGARDGAGEGETEGFEGDEWEEGEVERGMLHALVELGHLEMLLHQVSYTTLMGNSDVSCRHT